MSRLQLGTNLSGRLRAFRGGRAPPTVATGGVTSTGELPGVLRGTSAFCGLGSDQDHVRFVETPRSVVLVVADGHNGNAAIDWVRGLTDEDWVSALAQVQAGVFPNPVAVLEADLATNGPCTRHSGVCMVICEIDISGDSCELDMWSVGDCRGQVWVDGVPIAETTPHSPSDEAEVARVIALQAELGVPSSAVVSSGQGLLVGSTAPDGTPRATTGIHSRVRIHRSKDDPQPACLQPSRCLGHNGGTGDVVDHVHVRWTRDQSARVVIATDGLHDVCGPDIDVGALGPDAEGILTWAARRWLGDWQYVHTPTCPCSMCMSSRARYGTPHTQIQDGIAPDDIGVGVLEWRPAAVALATGGTRALQQNACRSWCPSPGCLLEPEFESAEALAAHVAAAHPDSP